jgi:high-affinity nickel-transport protein
VTVVLAFVAAIGIAASTAQSFQRALQGTGRIIGTLVSGLFPCLIAALNLAVLRGICRMSCHATKAACSVEELNDRLVKRGFMNRIGKGHYNQFINHSWQIYPVGLLFDLGFDTDSQVGLIAIAGSTGIIGDLPPLAVIALPILFAAGMLLMDPLGAVLISNAYNWAFAVGTVEIAGLIIDKTGLTGQPWDLITSIDVILAGWIIEGIVLAVSIGAILNWKFRWRDQRYGDGTHELTKPSGP